MRKTLLILALAAAGIAAGCAETEQPVAKANTTPANAAKTPQPVEPAIPFPDVPRITLAEAKADFDAGNAIFIDTRPGVSYQEEHVRGSINIGTAEEIAAKADTIPKGKKIIAYCS